MDRAIASKELAKKLDPSAVKPAKTFGPKGDYIEGWHAIAEANRIFGYFDWSYTIVAAQCVASEPRKIGKEQKNGWGVTYTAHVRILVDGVTREDFGAGHGYDLDLGLAHESAVKEAVTDALKRGLRTFGNPFGLALYDKTRENVGYNEPEPTPAPVRDPKAIADGLVAAFAKATTAQELKDGTADGTKAAQAWDWLEMEAKDHAARVKEAFDARLIELQPKEAA